MCVCFVVFGLDLKDDADDGGNSVLGPHLCRYNSTAVMLGNYHNVNRGWLAGTEHWEPWLLSTSLHHFWLHTGMVNCGFLSRYVTSQSSVFVCIFLSAHACRLPICACFPCVCLVAPQSHWLHITCRAVWECGALCSTSSCSDRPHYMGVGTS